MENSANRAGVLFGVLAAWTWIITFTHNGPALEPPQIQKKVDPPIIKKANEPMTPASVVPPAKKKDRLFDSNLALFVFEMNPNRARPKFLGITPTPKHRGIPIPAGSVWYVSSGRMGFGATGLGGPLPAGGALGFGGGAIGTNPTKRKPVGIGGFAGGGLGIAGGGPAPTPKVTPLLPGGAGLVGGPVAGMFGIGGGALGLAGVGPPAGMFGLGGGGGPIRSNMYQMARFPDKDLKALIAEIRKQSIPGLAIEGRDFPDDDLAELRGLTELQTLILRQTSVTDGGLKHLKGLPSLQNLIIESDTITDEGLTILKDLSPLNTLELTGTNITDGCVRQLKELRSLKNLRLRWTRVTDAGLKELASLENLNATNCLESLELLGLGISDAGIKPLLNLHGLKTLRLYLTEISDDGLGMIGKMADLKALTVDCCSDGFGIVYAFPKVGGLTSGGMSAGMFAGGGRLIGFSAGAGNYNLLTPDGAIPIPTGKITDAGLKNLQDMADLQELELASWNLTDDAMEAVRDLTNLKGLKLDSPLINDNGLVWLKRMTQLETLDLRCTRISGAGSVQLKNLPKLKTLYVSILSTNADLTRYRQTLPKGVKVSRGDLLEDPGINFLGNPAALPR